MSVGLSRLAPWPEIDGYLDRALDLEPAEREHWLIELTSSQAGVARILRELLRADCRIRNAPDVRGFCGVVLFGSLENPSRQTKRSLQRSRT